MNPENRTLRQVTIENAAESDNIFSMLMGDDVPPRREFLSRPTPNTPTSTREPFAPNGVITGASSRIGRAVARACHHYGVTASSSRPAAGQVLRRTSATEMGASDASSSPSTSPIPRACPNKSNRRGSKTEGVDVVIHSGGISQRSRLIDTDPSVDRTMMEVNYFGTLAFTRALLPTTPEAVTCRGHQRHGLSLCAPCAQAMPAPSTPCTGGSKRPVPNTTTTASE